MSRKHTYDAVIIGSGPNGLSAAVRLALEGFSVKVLESEETIGGGTRTLELTEPGFLHDICSAIHPMAAASPFLNALPLSEHGLEWIQPDIPLAHPMDHSPAILQHRDLSRMEEELGNDFSHYEQLFGPISDSWDDLMPDILGPLRFPDNPFRMGSFGLKALQSGKGLGNRWFSGDRAKALFGGLSAHSIMPLDQSVTSAIALILGAAAHSVGWPLPKGGSQMITRSMADYFQSLGGEIETHRKVESLDMLPPAKVVLFDLTPRQVLSIAGDRFSSAYRARLQKYRYGAGVFKIDYILNEPVPWSDPRCNLAGTVHVCGSLDEIVESERSMTENRHAEKPFVLVAQQSLFDKTRTPDDRHTLWAYCHVPNGSDRDMTVEIEEQIERFAPGFRDVIGTRITKTATGFEAYNSNFIGGDINGGIQNLRQLFSRPVSFRNPYATPADGIYFCSSSTPPGGGVHGMCGYHAAELVLRKEFGVRASELKFNL